MSLFSSLLKDDIEGVNKLLLNGEKSNQLNSSGQAPLHVIVTKSFRNTNTFPIIISLLKNKADINLQNKEGFTPIQVALQSGWQDTAAFLFQLGAKFDANIRKQTKITCPDCLKVVSSWESSNYTPVPYNYHFKQYNSFKL